MSQVGHKEKLIPKLARSVKKAQSEMFTIGNIEPYVLGECFTEYSSRLEMFFEVNDIQEEKKVPIMITLAGASLYSVAVNICAPDDVTKKSYAELVKVLKDYFAPVVNTVLERYKFRKLTQLSDQAISDYIKSLTAQAQLCNYGQYLADELRDQIVVGVKDRELRARLLCEPELKFDQACEIARNWEAAEQLNAAMVDKETHAVSGVRRLPVQQPVMKKVQQYACKKRYGGARKYESQCYRCGRVHDPDTCPAKSWKCYVCEKMGHVSRMCRSKPIQSENPLRNI